MFKFVAVLLLTLTLGPSLTGKHPVQFIQELASRPMDLFAADPNKGIVVPPIAPASWRKKERRDSYFAFYDTFTEQVMRQTPLGDACGRIQRPPAAKAYVADVAEGSTPVRGPHWENLSSFNTTVIKVTVTPEDHDKLLYLNSINRVLWNIEGQPAGVYLFGQSYLGRIELGVPVFSARHAQGCDMRNGLPRDVARKMRDEQDMMIFDISRENEGNRGKAMVGMLSSLEEQASTRSETVVANTSAAPIGQLLVTTRARQINF